MTDMTEQVPEKLLFTIQRYGFEEPPPQDEPAQRYEELTQEELVDICKELRHKVDMYATELEQELKSKLKQARMLTVLEMHLDSLPSLSKGHVQAVSLEHAVTWLGRYGHKDGEGLLIDVNDYQRGIMTKRIREIMHQAQLCDTRPACKHVLQARPSLVHPGELLTFRQIAMGLPLEKFLSTIDWSKITEDKEVWKQLDGSLEHYARNDDRIPPEELKKKSFLSLYFMAQTTPEFITTRQAYLANIQREGHEKKNLKACERVPQSGRRKTLNKMRRAMGNEDLETLSPTKSTMSGLAVQPRFGPGIPRPKRQSIQRLYETHGAAAIPMMTGAIRDSRVLSAAGASVDRDRRERSRSRSRTRHDHAANAPRLERIREGEAVPLAPQVPQLQRRERVRRHRNESGEPSRSGPGATASGIPRKLLPSQRNPVSPVSDSSRRQPVSPMVGSDRASPAIPRPKERRESPLVPKEHRKEPSHSPDIPPRKSSSASRSSGSRNVVHRLHPSARETPGCSDRRHKTPATPGTTPATDPTRRGYGNLGIHGPSNLSNVTQWPGQGAQSPSQERKERQDLKGKGKAKEEVPYTPSSNPYTSKEPTGLPDDWRRDPGASSKAPSKSSKSTHWPDLPSVAHKTPVPRPASSIYSVHTELHASAMPEPLRVNRDREAEPPRVPRNREARERLVDEDVPEQPETPAQHSKPAPSPSHKSSPGVSIPAGVDLTNVAGGLGHGYDFVRQRDSSSTIDKDRKSAVPTGVDLDTAAGTTSRYVPPRKTWDKERNPKSPMEEIKEKYQPGFLPQGSREYFIGGPSGYIGEGISGGGSIIEPYLPGEEGEPVSRRPRASPSPHGTLYTDTTSETKSKSSKGSLRHKSKKSPLIPENVYIRKPGEVDDPDAWSSQIGLPPSPGGTQLSRSKASQAFASPGRGRSTKPRSTENINYLSPVAETFSPAGSGSREPSRSPLRSTRFREHIETIIGSEYNPVTNPEPASREASRGAQQKGKGKEKERERESVQEQQLPRERERGPISRLFGEQDPYLKEEQFEESENEEESARRERKERRRAERRAAELEAAARDVSRRRQQAEHQQGSASGLGHRRKPSERTEATEDSSFFDRAVKNIRKGDW